MSKANDKYYGRTMPSHSNFTIEQSNRDRYTKKDWHSSNDSRFKTAEEQQKIAEKILCESHRIREQTEERTKINKETTDRRFTERLEDVQFNTSELKNQRKEVCLELEAFGIYRTRLIDCLRFIQENSLNQSKKCLEIRECREGIDLIVDEVEVALQKEIMIILNWRDRLQNALDQVEESMRRLRAVRYSLDEDLEQKEQCLSIEQEVINMKPTDLSLMKMNQLQLNDPANITKAEWEIFTVKNIQNATREIFMARPVRIMTDTYLQQVSEDLKNAYDGCNQALWKRIAEIKKTKRKLEDLLAETLIKIEAMTNNINCLQKSLDDKLPYLALAHTRIEKRTLRPNVELVKDAVCQSLHTESEMLRISTEQLQIAIQEAQTSLRYLTQVQIQLQEDIKIKTRSLEIDECECLTVRETMKQYQY